MADSPFQKKPGKNRPEIWASGGQRPPFDLRALGRASLFLSRTGVAPVHAWIARKTRRAAINVAKGAGRIPVDKLGRAERFVPSHLRVAGWIKNTAATLSHASASADPDVTRGNALVAEIEPHLWDAPESIAPPPAEPQAQAPGADSPAPKEDVPPVVLAEPARQGDDPLASIRGEMAAPSRQTAASGAAAAHPTLAAPPAPPGPVATGVIQVSGYLIGWASVIVALPYGLARALWLWASGRDLKDIS